MKFIKIKESNAHGNSNLYDFHLGIEEMRLMYGLIKNYLAYCPIGENWLPDIQRARNIRNAFKKILEPKPIR